MALEDELKARTLALVSQQMANWVVEIQKRIVEHQANLVGALDELQENVARYDEKIDEGSIGSAIDEVIAANPVAAAAAPAASEAGPGIAVLLSAMAEVDTGANLTEVLTSLVNESAKQVDRVAMFIIKGTNAVGWYAKGFDLNDAVKQIQIPLAGDTIFKTVQADRAPVLFDPNTAGQTAQALQRMGALGSSAIAAPMVLRDKLAAVLYCDTTGGMSDPQAAFIDALVRFAAKTTDLLSFVPRTPGARPAAPVVLPGASSGHTAAAPAARMVPPPAPSDGGGTVMFTPGQVAAMHQAATAPPPAPAPPPPPPAPKADGAGTVMFTASQMDQMRQQMSQMKPAAAPAAPAMSPEETKAHEDAKRFARLIVSEIKLYNEAKVTEGRKAKDLHSRLKEDIERGRQMYHDRISPGLRNNTNYFHDELVRLLAGGDPSALGPM
ncbi:MAG: hypothetical protein K1Y01_09180 [Vicinamibacteria bacterium]|nr:hypothetical protein [Vicinamibacteria bacterium]